MNGCYLSSIVKGMVIFPSIACRKGAVRLDEAEKTTSIPLKASHTPINNNCHWGNFRFSFMVLKSNIAVTRVQSPNTMTNAVEAKLSIKKLSMIPSVAVLFL